jgi:hypothetical protein
MKECKHKKDGICQLAKNLQWLSKLNDEDIKCKATIEIVSKCCPLYEK